MRWTTLLLALVMSLWPLVTVNVQPPAANPLPGPLRFHMNDDRFEVVTSVRGLPLGVREELQTLFRSATLDLADPGAPFRANGASAQTNLPTRRLVTAACSIDHCLVYYERGGTPHTWHLALFHWTPAATRFEWGGTAPAGLRTHADLLKASVSGSIGAAGPW